METGVEREKDLLQNSIKFDLEENKRLLVKKKKKNLFAPTKLPLQHEKFAETVQFYMKSVRLPCKVKQHELD